MTNAKALVWANKLRHSLLNPSGKDGGVEATMQDEMYVANGKTDEGTLGKVLHHQALMVVNALILETGTLAIVFLRHH